jgi:large subunit ribosomal protein L30
MAKKKQKQIKVTLVRSPIGYQPKHRECVRGLGLKRMHQTVVLEDTPSVRGMVNKIYYMVRVDEA